MRADIEEARERYLWQVALRILGTSLVVLSALGVSVGLTALLGWWRHLLPSALGLLAGGAISVAGAGSARGREWTGLALGAVTLPMLAAHLAAVGAQSDAAFAAYGARLVPFLAHAALAVLGGISIAALWRGNAPPTESGDETSLPERDDATARPPPPAAEAGANARAAERARRPSVEGAAP